jgi:hypothetical protein
MVSTASVSFDKPIPAILILGSCRAAVCAFRYSPIAIPKIRVKRCCDNFIDCSLLCSYKELQIRGCPGEGSRGICCYLFVAFLLGFALALLAPI